ncbi:hypothetical protein TNCV_256541 [Trichonephila clavipes]|nr:hypothetical protein TNCV_256541 [Trichonephila clavipes]
MWPMISYLLPQDIPSTDTSDQLWKYGKAAWTVVPQGYIQSLFDSMPRYNKIYPLVEEEARKLGKERTATAGSDVVQSGRPIFDDFFQHLWPYIGNNTANVLFQMVKRLRLIRIDQ